MAAQAQLPQITRQRATKLQDFVAHASTVNSVFIGRKSGTLMATGGDDKKVNIWSIGKPNCIASITGHQSAVECVALDANEQTVVAGSAGGTVKMWDLERQRSWAEKSGSCSAARHQVGRTLSGHRANCISVQWHPYGEFFASGSVDTNLKIWDVRRKTCIQTYKGHTRGVRQILFSPDGRWVLSGGDDGLIKLWDLTMGKLLHEFTLHTGAITALAIHPSEFLMASASADRTVRLWDLETFEPVCCTPAESSPVRRVCFSDDGKALLAGGEEVLKVWGWEPVRCYEVAEVRWSKLSDMCVTADNKLLAGSTREAMVAAWSVDLSTFRPLSGDDSVATPVGFRDGIPHALLKDPAPATLAMGAASAPPGAFATARHPEPRPKPAALEPPRTAGDRAQEGRQEARQAAAKADREMAAAARVEREAAAAARAEREAAAAARAPPPQPRQQPAAAERPPRRPPSAGAATVGTSAADLETCDPNSTVGVKQQIAGFKAALAAAKSSTRLSTGGAAAGGAPSGGAAAIAAAQARRNIELGYTPGGLHKDMSTSMGDSLMLGGNAGSGGDAQTAGLLETAQLPPARYQPPQPAARAPAARAAAAGAESAERASGSSGVPATREVPLGLDPAAFLPKHAPSAGASREEEARLVASLLQQGPTQASCLQSRLASLRVLRRYWAAGDVKAMVGQLAYLDDLSLLVDLLHAGAVLHPSLDLEGALLLLPLLVRLAASQFEHHQLAALDALQSLLASFGAVIAGTREAPRAVGVDLSREDRRRRCDDCHEQFVALQPHARRLASDGGRAQPAAAELLVAMRTQLGIEG